MRTFTIAILFGAAAGWMAGRLSRWPLLTVLALLPSFGGHWLEVWFLNWLRPRLPAARGVQGVVRVLVWFTAGAVFVVVMRVTANMLAALPGAPRLTWWAGGLGFIGIELIAHLVLMVRGRPSFYDGLG